jgi:hypothetical protein
MSRSIYPSVHLTTDFSGLLAYLLALQVDKLAPRLYPLAGGRAGSGIRKTLLGGHPQLSDSVAYEPLTVLPYACNRV